MKKLVFVLILLLPITALFAQTEVKGNIDEQIWIPSGSPYIVVGKLIINNLQIMPGVEIKVARDYEIEINGLLTAVGTEQDSIIFTKVDSIKGWQGLYFNSTKLKSQIRYCRIEYATNSGIRILDSTPLIDNCTFKNNSGNYGGGMNISNKALPGSVLTLSKCSFINNSSIIHGGGIFAYLKDSKLEIDSLLFLNNRTNPILNNGEYVGGAMYLEMGDAKITGCTFIGNRTNSRCSNVFACGVTASGGALYLGSAGKTDIANCSFFRNQTYAQNNGDCWFGGATHTLGSALFINSGTVNVVNCILAKNENLYTNCGPMTAGGGIYVNGGVVKVINSTIAENPHASGAHCSGGTLEIVNSIIYLNNSGQSQLGGTLTTTYSDIQLGFIGEGNIDQHPVFNDSLYHISSISPCVDAGHPGAQYNDIENNDRPGFALSPSKGGLRNDMGAYGGPGVAGTPSDTFPPIVANLIVKPNPTNGADSVQVTVDISDAGRGNSAIIRAEYCIDEIVPVGTGTMMSAQNGVFDNFEEHVTATIPTDEIGLEGSSHIIFVRGMDSKNNWSNVESDTVWITPKQTERLIAIPDTSAKRGEFLTIPLSLSRWEGIAGAEIKLTFSSNILRAIAVHQIGAFSKFVKQDTILAGKCVIVLADSEGTAIQAGSGDFLSIDFKVDSSATEGDTTTIAFSIANFFDEAPNLIDGVKIDNGLFTVGPDSEIHKLDRITIVPPSDTLGINETIQLIATGTDTKGKRMAIIPNWSVTPLFGNIGTASTTPASTITFTATGPGDGVITASQDGKTASAVIVVGKTRGDVNLDGADVVNVQDAILALQFRVGKSTPYLYQRWAADYDGSGGDPSEGDVMGILAEAVGRLLSKITIYSGSARVIVGAAEAREDGLISIPLSVMDRPDAAAGGLEITYDQDKMTPVAVTTAQSSTLLASNFLADGRIKVSAVNLEPMLGGKGEWLKLIFRPKAPLDEIPPLQITVVRLFDQAARPISAEVGSISVDPPFMPGAYRLYQNHPNPFNPGTSIRFDLSAVSHVEMVIFNTAGQTVRSLIDGSLAAGAHTAQWDGRDSRGQVVPAGVYFYRLIIDHGAWCKINKMILVK